MNSLELQQDVVRIYRIFVSCPLINLTQSGVSVTLFIFGCSESDPSRSVFELDSLLPPPDRPASARVEHPALL